MPVSPTLPGRLPETYRFQRLGAQLARIQSQSVRFQDQAASGVRVGVGSDDPAAAVRAGLMQRSLERVAATREQTAAADRFLAATDAGLAAFTDVAIETRTLLQSGIGLQASPAEKLTLADEAASLRETLLLEANRTSGDRRLFAGTGPDSPPFADLGGGRVLYSGDLSGVPGRLADGALGDSATDGDLALRALTPAEPGRLAPALTDDTPLAALHGGLGVTPGELAVSLEDGAGNAASATVDLAGARTVGDLRVRLGAAFAAGPPGLSVGFTPGGGGLELAVTPAGGATASVTVGEVPGGRFARDLGLAPGSSATPGVRTGGPLEPRVTAFTPLAALNGGAGMDLAAGLRITQGEEEVTVDLSAAATVGEAVAAIERQAAAAGVFVLAGIDDGGGEVVVRGRVSGADFAIGEAGGTTAGDLGVRTFAPSSRLADLNGGAGVPTDRSLTIRRRDGSAADVDLSAAATVGDVLAAVNAVDPGVLTASLNAAGNGITLADSSAPPPPDPPGPLGVADSPVAAGLGLSGEAAPGEDLVGADPHPRRTGGLADLLTRLETALRAGDDAALTGLGEPLDGEIERLAGVRATVGTRRRRLEGRQTGLVDEELALRESLSEVLDADLAQVFARITALQTAYEATLRLTAQTAELSLVNFL